MRTRDDWQKKAIGHFRVPPGLCIKTRLSAQPLIWKWFFILTQIKLIFTRKVVHLASFWKWVFLELGCGLLELRTNNGGMNAYRFFRQQVKRQLKLAAKIHVKSEIFSSQGNNTVCKVLNCCLKYVKQPIKDARRPQGFGQRFLYIEYFTSPIVNLTVIMKAS